MCQNHSYVYKWYNIACDTRKYPFTVFIQNSQLDISNDCCDDFVFENLTEVNFVTFCHADEPWIF